MRTVGFCAISRDVITRNTHTCNRRGTRRVAVKMRGNFNRRKLQRVCSRPSTVRYGEYVPVEIQALRFQVAGQRASKRFFLHIP